MAVVPDFMATYSWAREMARHRGRLVAVQFRIPDDEIVLFGHYAEPTTEMTAAEAVAVVLRADDARGFQIVVPRRIEPAAIQHVREAPMVGWRYSPQSKERSSWSPTCPCPMCRTRGEVGEAKRRQQIIASRLPAAGSTALDSVHALIDATDVAIELGERREARRLLHRLDGYVEHDIPEAAVTAGIDALDRIGSGTHMPDADPRGTLSLLLERFAQLAEPQRSALLLVGRLTGIQLDLREEYQAAEDAEREFDEARLRACFTQLDDLINADPAVSNPEAADRLAGARDWMDEIAEVLGGLAGEADPPAP